jgi:hypothetical protein
MYVEGAEDAIFVSAPPVRVLTHALQYYKWFMSEDCSTRWVEAFCTCSLKGPRILWSDETSSMMDLVQLSWSALGC